MVKFMKDLINRRLLLLIIITVFSFFFIIYSLNNIMIDNHIFYVNKLKSLKTDTIYSTSTPRGRIYDRNYNLLVDNVGVKTIFFKRFNGIKDGDIKKTIKLLHDNIEIDYSLVDENMIKKYYKFIYKNEFNNKLTQKEKEKYKRRILSKDDLDELCFKRITKKEMDKVSKEEAYIYYLMNKGYYYDENVIKTYASDEEYAYVASNLNELKGINVKLEWERKYIYGDTFRTILGNISSSSSGVPIELKDYYLSKGYSLNDKVGISFLEYQYEDLLKGEKAIYKLNDDNSYSLLKDGKRGNDIVLTIDINLQKAVEDILDEEVMYAKKYDYNTSLYDGSSVIIVEPSSGEILAFASKYLLEKNNDYMLYDNSPSLLTNPVTPGSMIKGASISTGYKEHVIDIGSKFYDECIKILNTPKKCSWSNNIGLVNDLEALAISSNVYQYKTAIAVAGANYYYNSPLVINSDAFDKYRNMFKQYGLGIKTNIDLPVESIGEKGIKYDAGLLLDLSIGQYDTYTPVQLASYISTIASYGNRYQLHFLKEIRDSSNDNKIGALLERIEPKLLNTIDLDKKYIDRIREGFKRVMYQTGYGYMGELYDSAGKTGTAESFKDTDNDGYIDKETISKGFVGYAPSENPKFSMVILSPNVKYNENSEYISPVNYKISRKVANKVFEFLK